MMTKRDVQNIEPFDATNRTLNRSTNGLYHVVETLHHPRQLSFATLATKRGENAGDANVTSISKYDLPCEISMGLLLNRVNEMPLRRTFGELLGETKVPKHCGIVK